MNFAEAVSSGIAAVSVLGTLALLILHLSLRASLGDLRNELEHGFQIELGKLALQIAQMETALERANSTLYEKVNTQLADNYMHREESLRMHAESRQRLDRLEHQMEQIQDVFRKS